MGVLQYLLTGYVDCVYYGDMKLTHEHYKEAMRKRRIALAKRRKAGESVAEIAKSLGISRQAVDRAIRNAK